MNRLVRTDERQDDGVKKTKKKKRIKKEEMIYGIVGGGICGLAIAIELLRRDATAIVYVWEAGMRPGGRARMGEYRGIPVVGGAGVVRARDRRLRKLCAELGVPLTRFTTAIQYAFPIVGSRDMAYWVSRLESDRARGRIEREKSFEDNFRRLYGEEMWGEFCQLAGYTDFARADPIDTLEDYGFEDNMPGQTMFGVDWDLLVERMVAQLNEYPGFHLETGSRVRRVAPLRLMGGGFTVQGERIDVLFWTTARPGWDVLTDTIAEEDRRKWRGVLEGVACQPFLRAYAEPLAVDRERAREKFPRMTFMEHGNPTGKILPYKGDVYMISYSDNENAERSRRLTREQWQDATGVRWRMPPRLFYHECGTHYYRPLDTEIWPDREAFLRFGRAPAPGVFVANEGLSRDQGWTEGALASAHDALKELRRSRSGSPKMIF